MLVLPTANISSVCFNLQQPCRHAGLRCRPCWSRWRVRACWHAGKWQPPTSLPPPAHHLLITRRHLGGGLHRAHRRPGRRHQRLQGCRAPAGLPRQGRRGLPAGAPCMPVPLPPVPNLWLAHSDICGSALEAPLPGCWPSPTQPLMPPTHASQIYHYMGGVRHMYWDHAKYGNQVRLQRPAQPCWIRLFGVLCGLVRLAWVCREWHRCCLLCRRPIMTARPMLPQLAAHFLCSMLTG